MHFKFLSGKENDSFQNLFGHVRTRIFIKEDLYLDVGRFSNTAIKCLRLFSNAKFKGMAAHIGDFCEFAESEIFLGGEHKNNDAVNFNFSASPVFQKLLLSKGIDIYHHRKGPVRIGDGVIVGQGARILSGVSISDGVVIGTGSVVSSDCESFGIYGGVPAKLIKKRNIDRKKFHEFMHSNVESIYQTLSDESFQPIFENDLNRNSRVVVRIHFLDPEKGGAFGYKVVGVIHQGQFIPLREDSAFYRYCMQAALPTNSEIEWIANPFDLEF